MSPLEDLSAAAIARFATGVGYLAGTLGSLLSGWLYGAAGVQATPLRAPPPRRWPIAVDGSMLPSGRYLEDKDTRWPQ